MENNFPDAGDYSKVSYTYLWKCSHCGDELLRTFDGRKGDSIICVALPSGWTKISDWLYCPAHSIVLLVDGAAVHV